MRVLPLAIMRRSRPPYRGTPPSRARVRQAGAVAADDDGHDFSITASSVWRYLLTMPYTRPSDDELRAILGAARTIAVVGASSKADRPSHGIMKILIAAGFRVIPVTPRESTVLGRKAYGA